MHSLGRGLAWTLVAGFGAFAYVVLATRRQEPVSSAYILVAALCTYAIGYRFYSRWIAAKALQLDDRRATPCERHEDGRDFVKTHRWIVFGHHFAAISGPGPLVGPVLAAQFGYLPGTLWILIGVVLGGAAQDFLILGASMRRNGRSLGQMVKDELNPFLGALALVSILSIMIILLAVLGLVVVKVLAESPWGVFTVGATLPIALLMGLYLRYLRPGKTLEGSVLGVVLLLAAVWGGQWVHSHPEVAKAFTFTAEPLAWSIVVYGFAASVLPVWLLLAPRDYLSTFMKLGTIVALAGGVLLVLPTLKMPALTSFIDGSGPVVPGKLFPFCFITIACGAISGFHTLIASGITPKIITRESYARPIGYGAMLLESLVAIMALIAACTLEPGVYLAINIPGVGADAAAVAADTVAKVRATGFALEAGTMESLARQVGEASLYGRTGGAATLAVGMANLFSQVTHGRWLDVWYHFAIMFEALFILTTLDAGTRVGRYLLQDALGHLWKPLGDVRSTAAGALASALIVAGWGWFLIQGVRDPLGGINSLWPLFGIANQLLAAIALVLAATVLIKQAVSRGRSTAIAWVALLPLIWLLAVTGTAGVQKIFHPSPRIGFLATVRDLDQKLPALRQAAEAAPNDAAARKAVAVNRSRRMNNALDAGVTGVFLVLAGLIVGGAVVEWIRLLRGRKSPDSSEEAPVWLPETALAEGGRRTGWAGIFALGLALLRHWSGQESVDREARRLEAAVMRDTRSQAVLIPLPEVAEEVRRHNAPIAYQQAAETLAANPNRCC
jgi:carbon starvation protein